ncbi:Uncharacterized protein DAT39_000098 [Clarias magur]|uniref:Uncharacterized protein n=1 Tax=Clarias magur TaxID=1594786 RepID=A0A8J5C9H4_CLAMG|nr:Uncharacterized protein DAT39_000098 [Clarias magur]
MLCCTLERGIILRVFYGPCCVCQSWLWWDCCGGPRTADLIESETGKPGSPANNFTLDNGVKPTNQVCAISSLNYLPLSLVLEDSL